MAVAITQTDSQVGQLTVDNGDGTGTSPAFTLAIGAADAGRIVAVIMTSDNPPLSVIATSPTGQYNTHDNANAGDVSAALVLFDQPTGTSVSFQFVHTGSPIPAARYWVSAYSILGASQVTADVTIGEDTSLDMDSTDPLTTGSITIPESGGILLGAGAGADAVGVTWANATESLDLDGGTGRHTSAISTTAGTVTITCTGTTNNDDGAMVWAIFKPVAGHPATKRMGGVKHAATRGTGMWRKALSGLIVPEPRFAR